jgi:hypothetical protein
MKPQFPLCVTRLVGQIGVSVCSGGAQLETRPLSWDLPWFFPATPGECQDSTLQHTWLPPSRSSRYCPVGRHVNAQLKHCKWRTEVTPSIYCFWVWRFSSVSEVTDCELDDRSSISDTVRRFVVIEPSCQSSVHWVCGALYQGQIRPEREADRPHVRSVPWCGMHTLCGPPFYDAWTQGKPYPLFSPQSSLLLS